MSIPVPQNFYKETVAAEWSTGGGNFYVSTKPTVSVGYLVISPQNSSIREIVKFTAVGTDGGGDYVTVLAANRGLGGTTEQSHAVGERVYMNVTAENIQEISDAIDQIVAAGAQDASTITKGIVKLSTAPASATEPIAVGVNDTNILPTSDQKAAMAAIGSNAPDTDNKYVTEDDLSDPTFKAPQIVTFTSSDTWTKDAGLKYIIVEVQAPGGGGGGADTDFSGFGQGNPGGGGGYSRKLILASALGATETVTIGAAGTAGITASSPTNGGNGGTTSFGAHVTANGGNGGTSANRVSNPATGGTASGGDINITGGTGGGEEVEFTTGGDAVLGKGGLQAYNANTQVPGYGGGGAGGNEGSPSPTANGQAGGAGIIIVTEYYS